ncbi:STAS domain-containing protein [Pseudoxanthomonas dokdonensis]|uniref:Anti-sigma factor antagonist n=1 Tax=Pseudoxanthomonas dokdonensis TaxID=344882 RepID=A0A0R0CLY7_9GAMM|nr:STAS domain-containing protein [Pseudoxanthomonas dokdonensis]KRG71037.1 anti-sigma factor antagonist [Pseudoxanthomonas dokdonensis]
MSALPLAADLGIETATDLKQQLAARLEQAEPLLLDAGSVQRVHTASLQVLCTFVRERSGAGRDTGFSATSASFLDAVRLLGLGQSLGLANDNNNTHPMENPA